jgi:hypothetical protein
VSEAALDARVAKLLAKKRKAWLDEAKLSPEQLAELDPGALARRAEQKALRQLDALVAAGVIDEARRDAVIALPPPLFHRELEQLRKERFLKRPPAAFLELAADERERLASLPAPRFHDEVRKLLPRADGRKGKAENQAVAADGRERGAPKAAGRGTAVMRWLDGRITAEERAALRAADPIERRMQVRRRLEALARAALARDGRDVRLLDEISALPPGDREVRLVQLIDPRFDPRRPARFDDR